MAINEKIVTGRKFRRLIDKEAKLWQLISWWTKSSDVECDDGKTVEQKIGNINGITDDVYNNRSDIAQSSAGVFTIRNALDHGIINDRIQFVIDENGKLCWKKDGADTVLNFSSGLSEKILIGSSNSFNSHTFDVSSVYDDYSNLKSENFWIVVRAAMNRNNSAIANDSHADGITITYDSTTGKVKVSQCYNYHESEKNDAVAVKYDLYLIPGDC